MPLRETLTNTWCHIQGRLFPWLAEAVGPLTVLYRRERWQLPNGGTLLAPLPAGITTHYGPELKRWSDFFHRASMALLLLLFRATCKIAAAR